jgi:putative nucleotidyltransferase with HDIG domain
MTDTAATSLPSRADALALMREYTASESLQRHMLAVEAAMRAYAERLGGDPERWGLAGLMHDFDYERYPNAAHSATEEHPAEGVRVLRARGYRRTCSRRSSGTRSTPASRASRRWPRRSSPSTS